MSYNLWGNKSKSLKTIKISQKYGKDDEKTRQQETRTETYIKGSRNDSTFYFRSLRFFVL